MMINYYEFSLIRSSFFFTFIVSPIFFVLLLRLLMFRPHMLCSNVESMPFIGRLWWVFTFQSPFVFVCGYFFFGDEENTEQLSHIKTMFVRNDCGFKDRRKKIISKCNFRFMWMSLFLLRPFFLLLEIETIKSVLAVLKNRNQFNLSLCPSLTIFTVCLSFSSNVNTRVHWFVCGVNIWSDLISLCDSDPYRKLTGNR